MIHKRGCGYRVPGGIYLITDVNSTRGVPIDNFLFDPPWVPFDKDGVRHYPGALGVEIVQAANGINYVWDWIGQESYPYFPDFWEETRRFGLSRKVSPGLNFDLLNSKSQIIGFHKYGIMHAKGSFFERLLEETILKTSMDTCPINVHIHGDYDSFCIRQLWQAVDEQKNENESRLHKVYIPHNDEKSIDSYRAASLPYWAKEPKYEFDWIPAAMFHLPITRIEVIEDSLEGKHETAITILEKSITNLPFNVVKE